MALDEKEIAKRLQDLPGWRRSGKEIEKRWRFPDYPRAVLFANAVAYLAERADHHPDLTVGYGYVQVRLTSHDAGALTDRDFRLAREIEGLGAQVFAPEE